MQTPVCKTMVPKGEVYKIMAKENYIMQIERWNLRGEDCVSLRSLLIYKICKELKDLYSEDGFLGV